MAIDCSAINAFAHFVTKSRFPTWNIEMSSTVKLIVKNRYDTMWTARLRRERAICDLKYYCSSRKAANKIKTISQVETRFNANAQWKA